MNPNLGNMFQLLQNYYRPQDGSGIDEEEELRRKQLMSQGGMMPQMRSPYSLNFAPPPQDPGMASDIFSAIGGGIGPGGGILGGIVPNVLAAIFKKRS